MKSTEQYLFEKREILKTVIEKWRHLEEEAPDKFLSLVKKSFKTSISRDTNVEPGKLGIAVNVESDMNDAEAYIEEIRIIIEDVRDTSLENIDELIAKLKESDNNKEKLSYIELIGEFLDFLQFSKLQIYKDNIVNFNFDESLHETRLKLAKMEEDIRDEEDAKRYGCDIKDLPNHRKYVEAKRKIPNAKTAASLEEIVKMFESVSGYLDADEWADEFREKAKYAQLEEEAEEKAKNYDSALALFNKAKNIKGCDKAIEAFEKVRNYEDVETLLEECKARKEQFIKEEEERKAEEKRLHDEAIYNDVKEKMATAKTEEDYWVIIDLLAQIEDYKDALALREECNDLRFEAQLNEKMELAEVEVKKDTLESLDKAIEIYGTVAGYNGADDRIEACKVRKQEIIDAEEFARQKAEQERLEKEKQKKKKIRNIIIALCTVIVIGISIPIYINVVSPLLQYNKAIKLMENTQYDEAKVLFKELGYYKEAKTYILECDYRFANDLFNNQQYEEAAEIFDKLDYKDSRVLENQSYYLLAKDYFDKKEYLEASNWFKEAGYYEDSVDMKKESLYLLGLEYFANGEYELGYTTLYGIYGYKDAKDQAFELYYQYGLNFYEAKDFEKSNAIFKKLKTYKDSALLIHNHKYTSSIIADYTCETDGITVYTCDCGDTYTETKVAEGHKYQAATCINGEVCSECKHEIGTPLGHTNSDGICERCGYNSMAPIVFSGSSKSKDEPIKYTISVPKGSYNFEMVANPSKSGSSYEMWSVKVGQQTLFFGYGNSMKKGTFNAYMEFDKDAKDVVVAITMKGSYTLTITPRNK